MSCESSSDSIAVRDCIGSKLPRNDKREYYEKTFLIGIKDLKLMFRDRAALMFMLLAPFLLTLGMGFVTGRFSGSSSGLSDIPVIIVNLDNEQLGQRVGGCCSTRRNWRI